MGSSAGRHAGEVEGSRATGGGSRGEEEGARRSPDLGGEGEEVGGSVLDWELAQKEVASRLDLNSFLHPNPEPLTLQPTPYPLHPKL